MCLLSYVASHNQLRSLPVEVFTLKNLRSLTLQQNLLESLPEELGQLENLIELVTNTYCIILPPGSFYCVVWLADVSVLSVVIGWRMCPTTIWRVCPPVWAVSPACRNWICVTTSSAVCLTAWPSSQVRSAILHVSLSASLMCLKLSGSGHYLPQQ